MTDQQHPSHPAVDLSASSQPASSASAVVGAGEGGDVVFDGVDTHHDVHVVAAMNRFGVRLRHASFETTPAGYRGLLGWLAGRGPVATVGVEGTGSYGAGLARYLAGEGIEAIEVNRPDRADRRRREKSDPIDAESTGDGSVSSSLCKWLTVGG